MYANHTTTHNLTNTFWFTKDNLITTWSIEGGQSETRMRARAEHNGPDKSNSQLNMHMHTGINSTKKILTWNKYVQSPQMVSYETGLLLAPVNLGGRRAQEGALCHHDHHQQTYTA